MTTVVYQQIISAPPRDRLDLFLATANRLGTPIGNVEKDFWVCWTLNALYHERPATGPRLLFKGGTSLSKAYGLIERFSEDIDVTVFRDDLDEAVSLEDLEALSNKKRRARLDAIRDACRAYITGPLYTFLGGQVADATSGAGRMEIDQADPDGQTLLLWYPEVEPRDGAYVRPVVRIESGAKSALDPNQPDIAAKWADHRKVPQIALIPDWTKHAKAAPFKRNDQYVDTSCRSGSWLPRHRRSGQPRRQGQEARHSGLEIWERRRVSCIPAADPNRSPCAGDVHRLSYTPRPQAPLKKAKARSWASNTISCVSRG